MTQLKSVSVLIPAYNEAAYIAQSVESFAKQDYPPEKLEVIVIDGRSTDVTRELVHALSARHPNVRLVDNPYRTVPFALNLGIRESRGEVVIIISAHGFAAPDFVRKNVEALQRTGADCVGGAIDCIADSDRSRVIAAAMRSGFGIGNSALRACQTEGYVSHLAFPCYPKRIFEKVGSFDEEMVKNQDDEFNFRLRKAGGSIYFAPEIRSYYYVRPSLRTLWNQYFRFGLYKVRVFQKHPAQLSLRHFVPAALVAGLVLSLSLALFDQLFGYVFLFTALAYVAASLIASFLICRRQGFKYFLVLPAVFATLHFSYGAGFIWGFVKFFSKWRKRLS
jgi:glycosyltransferase involved in cell wall biosynthesis